ncbi:SGNH hydrolase-type esterase domain-containing protein [Flagelloscypha sp. PMI_526]|nr:SGNH hydrolase-type esterase domain-containing protein [Flagelloscypha sp. PMI_526]
MRASTSFFALVLAALAQAAPTIYLAGDSTTADYGANNGITAGWGKYFPNYVTGATVVNKAVGGTSARSYTRDGYFAAITPLLKSGDYVVIEFGHNDGGSLSTDNGRTDCGVGSAGYNTTCSTTYNGVAETVLTYEKYLVNAATTFKAKGANVIFSSPTPNNPCESGTCSYTAARWTGYCQDAATETAQSFVDHGQYFANLFISKGATVVNGQYYNSGDHTHTTALGADQAAISFVTAVKASNSTLKSYLK